MFKTFKYIFVPAVALLITMMLHNWIKDTFLPNIPEGNSKNKGEVLIGGAFELVNQDGKVVTDKDFLGKYMVVYFGFANCPMVCPTDMADITSALNSLDERTLEKIQPIFITIDPLRDTVENVKLFIENFHPKFQGLTGTPEKIASAINTYRVYSKKAESEDLQGYLMDHSAYTYLMGKDGKYIAHFRHYQGAENISLGFRKYIR